MNDCSVKDAFILSQVGIYLRKLNESGAFINKLTELGLNVLIKNQYVLNAYIWCLYDVEIKSYEYSEDIEAFNKFQATAQFITNNCKQLSSEESHKNPYILTIKKYIRIIKNRAYANPHNILEWVNKLNPELLSMEPQKWNDFSVPSDKEFYYYIRSKALEKTNSFEECIKCCERALTVFENQKLHYGNNIWFIARKLYCKCRLNLSIDTIRDYEKVTEKYKFWYMYHKVSELYFSIGETKKALICSLKALLSDNFDCEKMINLFFDIGLLLETENYKREAKMFYHCAAHHRSQFRWYINEELRFAIKEYEIDIEENVDHLKLKEVAANILIRIDGFIKGKITMVDISKKFGFITYDKNKSIHFNFKTLNRKIDKDKDIIFKIGYNLKNKKETAIEAFLI